MEPHPYGQAFAAGDLEGVLSLCTDDVIYHSPLVIEPGFEGRDAVAAIFGVAMPVFEDTQYTHDFGDGQSHVLIADVRVLDVPMKITTLLEYNSDGKIREIWMMVRTVKGATALALALGERFPGRDRSIAELSKPMLDLAAMLDRAGSRIVNAANGLKG